MPDSHDKGKAPERKDKPDDVDASDTTNGTIPSSPPHCPLAIPQLKRTAQTPRAVRSESRQR